MGVSSIHPKYHLAKTCDVIPMFHGSSISCGLSTCDTKLTDNYMFETSDQPSTGSRKTLISLEETVTVFSETAIISHLSYLGNQLPELLTTAWLPSQRPRTFQCAIALIRIRSEHDNGTLRTEHVGKYGNRDS